MSVQYVPEPFRIKSIEPVKCLTREEREKKIKDAQYNLFNLSSKDVYIDLLTDSGTGAMSQEQWAGLMKGDEAYAGSKSHQKLVETAQDIFGYEYIQPVHQGRAAEKILFSLVIDKGQYSLSNAHFDTTRAHVQLSGAKIVDCGIPEAKDLMTEFPFKGNMDCEKLEAMIAEYGADAIGIVIMTVTNNLVGGQPVSMQNIRRTSEICRKHGIMLCIDAARYAENAFFIKKREKGYADKSIKEIVREMFSYSDMFTMSAKKDAIVNIGGLVGIKSDKHLEQEVKNSTIIYEGFVGYGGLSGRDIECLSIGLIEGLDEDYLAYRIGQAEYLGAKLREQGIHCQFPTGGHGVYVDAQALLPHIPYNQFPGQAFAIELYKEAGIRTVDVGSFLLGNDSNTGKQLQSMFEFTRLCIPRRVYTQSHLDIVVDAMVAIQKRSNEVSGYKTIWEPPILRHFQAQLLPIRETT